MLIRAVSGYNRICPRSPARKLIFLRICLTGRYSPNRLADSHRDLCLDVRVRIVAFEREILVAEGEEIGRSWIEPHSRQRSRWPRKLQPRLLHMVEIKVRVSERVHELAGLEFGYMRHHQRQQRVGGDVERYAEEGVGRTL